ncbi:helix-turn-helix transcriptional regulator [Glaciihabitans sp. INWT7]|uniref:ArsR/SmtB family transcription factor n=1 Tax=Glaciihabitans sp. INWT7 TaxID=2596912 RepID=UPI001629B7A9|nr:helix-turn-helix domain-containing protein [Glaciihabitans sp. INWT7]QNE47425.1 helix-turn-helix transcriptional regulator [Glaciihabitans sp. INWT7]
MSFKSIEPVPEHRTSVTDARALRALAHPLRLAILNHLMAFGAQTASACAEAVGSTASNCSYHLRSLARYGFVESLPSADGRERPWRSAATGFEFRGEEGTDAAATAVERLISEAQIDDGARLQKKALAVQAQTPAQWRDAASANSYALLMTPTELRILADSLDALIRPYIGLTRADPPEDSEVVYLQVDAFRHPDAGR